MIRALVFDFDGTIIDSETPVYESWCAAYAEHGHTMPRERYLELIGTANHTFDPHGHLEQLCGYPIDRATLDATRMGRHRAVIASAGALPGVLDWIEEAVQRKLGLAVASSSQMWWVESNLERLGLRGHFPVVRGRETVRATKPAPDLFLGAVADLGVAPHEAIAIEDSAHGVAAAKAAGL
jgi:HAD superfamily hydrolase (TIGR01509 family)